MSQDDWNLLEIYKTILQVFLVIIMSINYINKNYQVPHAFQEILSAENTPTICSSIPAFESFIDVWRTLLEERPEWWEMIQPGLDKLEEYEERLTDVHIIAMGEIKFIFLFYYYLININI